MSEDRPMERKRARRGLGARSVEGENVSAEPRGRMRPSRSRNSPTAGPEPQPKGRAKIARRGQARRRTVRDNPEGV